jgi:hypothetical protein
MKKVLKEIKTPVKPAALEAREKLLKSIRGKYATPGRSLAAELHDERQAEVAKSDVLEFWKACSTVFTQQFQSNRVLGQSQIAQL